MDRIKTISALLILTSFAGCRNPETVRETPCSERVSKTILEGNFSVSGAHALYPLIVMLANEFMTIHPGVKIEVSGTGTGAGVSGLIEKENHLAMISRPLTDEEVSAGVWIIPVAKDGVAPVINRKNPYLDLLLSQGLSTDEFQKIFTTGEPPTWGDVLDNDSREKINVYTRGDEAGAGDVWAEFLFRDRKELKGIKVTGDAEMIKSVQNDPLAIGYCNFSYAFDPSTGERVEDIQIVPVDLDFDNKINRKEIPFSNLETAHRSLWLGYYPKSLCRELTVGSLGKPSDPVIVEFLYFILGDGQKSISKAGFCELNNVYLRHARERLE